MLRCLLARLATLYRNIMKKTFTISHPKIKTARLFEAVKHDVKKYIRRERNKTLPEDTDYWDFDCKYGVTEDAAETIHLSKINKAIDSAEEAGLTSFYIEIMARAEVRKTSHEDSDDEELSVFDEDED